MLIALTFHILAVYGLANAITTLHFGDYYIHPLTDRCGRFIRTLFRCCPCLSFWIGILFSLTVLSPTEPLIAVKWKAVVYDGLIASGASYLLYSLGEYLDPTDESPAQKREASE